MSRCEQSARIVFCKGRQGKARGVKAVQGVSASRCVKATVRAKARAVRVAIVARATFTSTARCASPSAAVGGGLAGARVAVPPACGSALTSIFPMAKMVVVTMKNRRHTTTRKPVARKVMDRMTWRGGGEGREVWRKGRTEFSKAARTRLSLLAPVLATPLLPLPARAPHHHARPHLERHAPPALARPCSPPPPCPAPPGTPRPSCPCPPVLPPPAMPGPTWNATPLLPLPARAPPRHARPHLERQPRRGVVHAVSVRQVGAGQVAQDEHLLEDEHCDEDDDVHERPAVGLADHELPERGVQQRRKQHAQHRADLRGRRGREGGRRGGGEGGSEGLRTRTVRVGV